LFFERIDLGSCAFASYSNIPFEIHLFSAIKNSTIMGVLL